MERVKDFFELCKPKVVLVMLVTSWVGMALATHQALPWQIVFFGTLGIMLTAGSAAVINHLVDKQIDAKMRRTHLRPIASNRISVKEAILFSILLMVAGMSILLFMVNIPTALLTLASLGGYAGFYTLFLKRKTPQNIVIGGAAGAMPPLLGWTAVTGQINAEALLLVLIIFVWTPPHFWALAIYRREDYMKAEIPMLPVTHGVKFTKLCIVLYTLLLFAVTLLPFVIGMSHALYLVSAMILGMLFIFKSLWLYKSQDEKIALKTFHFSIIYLLLLFIMLLVDHGLHT